jgi:hypothetical protein
MWTGSHRDMGKAEKHSWAKFRYGRAKHKMICKNSRLQVFDHPSYLTLILLTWTIWRAPTNASKWRMGFNSAFKGLIAVSGNILIVQAGPVTILVENFRYFPRYPHAN